MHKTKMNFVLLLALALAAPVAARAGGRAERTAAIGDAGSDRGDEAGARSARRDSRSRVASLVETKVVPLFDFSRMTQIAVARNWRLATPGQQAALTAAFKTLLVRTYSTGLVELSRPGDRIQERALGAGAIPRSRSNRW